MRRVAAGVALAAAVTVLAVAGLGGVAPMAVAAVGAVILAVGLARRRRPLLDAGALGLLAGGTLAGIQGLPPGLTLLATVSAVLAWDAATVVVELDDQLTLAAETARLEVVHVGATTVATAAIAALVYGATVAGGSLPGASAVVLVLGALVVGVGLRSWVGA